MLIAHAQQAARGHSFIGTLDLDHLWFAQQRDALDQRAVDPLSMTPPGGATDSIRCAMPTCSPIVV